MYSNEIAINHLIDHLVIEPDKLDFSSTSDDRIESHPHIHCWHTDEPFQNSSLQRETIIILIWQI